MSKLFTSVLIPTYRRPQALVRCLFSLKHQTILPDELIVVWQGDDVSTQAAIDALVAAGCPCNLKLLHSNEVGIVPAENLALAYARGEIVLLIDDDAVAPPDWIAKHLTHYTDPKIGAVGGPAENFRLDGTSFPKRDRQPVGKLTWYGKTIGNMYDQIDDWRSHPPIEVDHLVGYNMSIRRGAFGQFDPSLKPYWQNFELEACLQVKERGYRTLFDFSIVVEHYPTNEAYTGGREGDLSVKIYNAAYNRAYVLAKHSSWYLRPWRFLYLVLIHTMNIPGLLLWPFTSWKFGRPIQEWNVVRETFRNHLLGWKDGNRTRG